MDILDLKTAHITMRKRQRTSIATGPLNELCESIAARGLLHPPTMFPLGDNNYLLIAGERRFNAIKKLHEQGRSFSCDRVIVGKDELPILTTSISDILGQRQIEYDENQIREALTWQDRATALAEIHELLKAANPKQSRVDTAKQLIASKQAETLEGAAATSPHYVAQEIREAELIAKHLDDPTIAKARNANEAHALILKQIQEQADAEIARRRLQTVAAIGRPTIEIRHDDCTRVLPTLDEGLVDLVLSDPPYGIDAGSGGFRGRTVHHHNYKDDMEAAKEVLRVILSEGFRVTKRRANLILFTDIKHWDWLQIISGQIGWVPFRTPIIWKKSDSEGLAPWGSLGPRRTYDVIFYATKGQRGMVTSPTDIWEVKRVPRNERIHAAEKPVELLTKAIECTTLAGDFVLDPCCGSGSTLVAARETKRLGLGIERDANFYATAMANVYKNGEGLDVASESDAIDLV